MPKTGHLRVHQLARVADGIGEDRRVPGSITQEDAVRRSVEQFRRGGRRREDADVTPVCAEPPQDVPLHPEVVGGDLQPPIGAPFGYRREFVRWLRRPVERRLARDTEHQIGAFHRRNGSRLLDELARVDVPGRDHAAHDARRAQHSRQRASIDVGDGDDAVAGEIVAERAF